MFFKRTLRTLKSRGCEGVVGGGEAGRGKGEGEDDTLEGKNLLPVEYY